jgi:hypothetical protein
MTGIRETPEVPLRTEESPAVWVCVVAQAQSGREVSHRGLVPGRFLLGRKGAER